MKNQLLFGLLGAAGSIALAGSLASCSDNYDPTTESDGQLMVTLGLDKEVVSSRPKQQAAAGSRADAQSVSASDLTLKITSEDGKYSYEFSPAELSSPVSVPALKYNVEAIYGSAEEEGFEKPYYYGTSSITVIENRATPVSVTARLANSMVRVEMSEIFRTYFESYSVSLRSELGTEFDYAADETRPLYLAAGQITTTIDITKKDGTHATLEPKSFTAEPRHSYVLQFDINEGSGADDAFLTLTYDDLCDVEDVEIDLSSEILNAPAPRLTPEGFASGDSWTVMPGSKSAKEAKVSVMAQGGLDGVVLSTTSAWLQQQGWPAEIDLVGADAATMATMKALGLRVAGVDKPAKMAVVDLTDVLSRIQYIEGGNNTATFTLQARDKNQRVAEQPLSFTVETTLTSLSVEKVYPIVNWGSTLELDIKTNAQSLDNLVISSQKESGSYATATIASITPVEGQEGVYHVVANGIVSTDSDLKARVQLGAVKVDFVIEHLPSPYFLTSPENGIYGWQVIADINYSDPAAAASRRSRSPRHIAVNEVEFEISSNGGKSWTTPAVSKMSDGRYLIKGLNGGTAYQLRAYCDGTLSQIFSFTTETGAQLENSDMETWSRTAGQTNYWWIDYPASSADAGIWATMNQLTTSEGGSSTSWTNRNGCSYSAYSGTQPTTDSRSGNAAYIATVGWGKGNSAAALFGMGTCQNVTAGQLYLGKYDTDSKSAVYGIAYANRPASLEFWYKYTAKNSADYGKATIEVCDSEGNVLASGSVDLTATDSYTSKVVDIKDFYPVPSAKAATLKVIFISSANSDCLAANANNLSYPPARNTSNGRYTGSELYIDDIKLNF